MLTDGNDHGGPDNPDSQSDSLFRIALTFSNVISVISHIQHDESSTMMNISQARGTKPNRIIFTANTNNIAVRGIRATVRIGIREIFSCLDPSSKFQKEMDPQSEELIELVCTWTTFFFVPSRLSFLVGFASVVSSDGIDRVLQAPEYWILSIFREIVYDRCCPNSNNVSDQNKQHIAPSIGSRGEEKSCSSCWRVRDTQFGHGCDS